MTEVAGNHIQHHYFGNGPENYGRLLQLVNREQQLEKYDMVRTPWWHVHWFVFTDLQDIANKQGWSVEYIKFKIGNNDLLTCRCGLIKLAPR